MTPLRTARACDRHDAAMVFWAKALDRGAFVMTAKEGSVGATRGVQWPDHKVGSDSGTFSLGDPSMV